LEFGVWNLKSKWLEERAGVLALSEPRTPLLFCPFGQIAKDSSGVGF